MSMRPTDRLIANARGDAETAIAYAEARGAKRMGDVVQYIHAVYRHAPELGLDASIVVTQAIHETTNPDPPHEPFWSSWWVNRRNPAGIGITGDPTQDAVSPIWANGEDAAKGHLYHLGLYCGVDFLPWKPYDPRWKAPIDEGYFGIAETINDLTGRWAVDPNYAEKVANKGNTVFPGIQHQEVHEPMARPTILVVAGHRSYGDAGNPDEKALTPALTRDYRDALRRAGYTVTWLQEADGDSDPDDTVGGLDTVGQKAAFWASQHPGSILMLDLHYEGSPARGCFAIVPDVTGLRTAVSAVQPANDTWEANTLDLSLARAWAQQMRAHTGLPLRQGIREPGVMDESQTDVGGKGFRLAMFAYTAPYRDRLVRLVLEHGNHTHPEDRKIINLPDFSQRCAAAAVAAINAIYELSVTTPQPEPEPEPAPTPTPTPTLLPLPDGMSWELVKRRFGHYVAPWNGHVFAFDPGRAYAQWWFNAAVRSIPAGKPYWYGSWPALDVVIRRAGSRLEYTYSDGSGYLSTPDQPEAKDAEAA